ncbi:hypothetical protein BDV95DRAFT_133032 [Massariosphaeria phaeospora]|uniref:Uncharacterized protein n=1 Tax=Massariosphaeria phaeospora TaxID=100035 RepID=A0A7C8IDW0_9PLEO|nr:hypothetical protein BDV95DRAFT_133032 [Massariosphaeria phaeospora]
MHQRHPNSQMFRLEPLDVLHGPHSRVPALSTPFTRKIYDYLVLLAVSICNQKIQRACHTMIRLVFSSEPFCRTMHRTRSAVLCSSVQDRSTCRISDTSRSPQPHGDLQSRAAAQPFLLMRWRAQGAHPAVPCEEVHIKEPYDLPLYSNARRAQLAAPPFPSAVLCMPLCRSGRGPGGYGPVGPARSGGSGVTAVRRRATWSTMYQRNAINRRIDEDGLRVLLVVVPVLQRWRGVGRAWWQGRSSVGAGHAPADCYEVLTIRETSRQVVFLFINRHRAAIGIPPHHSPTERLNVLYIFVRRPPLRSSEHLVIKRYRED